MPRLYFPNWGEIEQLSRMLAEKILDTGFEPETIIAVGRGGYVPARLIADYLGNKNLYSVKAVYYSSVGKTSQKVELFYPHNLKIRNKKILVVDDVSDTGKSLSEVEKLLRSKKPLELKVATLHKKPKTVFDPDYCVFETKDWIVYPWEKIETIPQIKDKKVFDKKDLEFYEKIRKKQGR